MRVHLAILRVAAMLVPEQQQAEWCAEWRSELWHAWQNPQETNLIAFCLGSFKDAWWLRRYGPMPRSYGVLHLDVPAPPAITQSFPERPGLHFLKSPAQCLSFLAALAAASIAVAFLRQPARDIMLASSYPDGRGLLMISPWGRGYEAGMANGLVSPYPTVSVDQFRQWKTSPMPEFSGLGFYLPQVMRTDISPGHLSIARTSADLFTLLHIPVPANGLILSNTAWRKHFHSDPHAVGQVVQVGGQRVPITAILPASQWKLPGHFDAWLIEDERNPAGLPWHAKGDARGFVLARVTDQALGDHGFPDGYLNYVWLADRNQSFLVGMWPLLFMLFMGALLVPVTTFFSLGDYPRRSSGPRRWMFLAAKIALILATALFGALDLASLGAHFVPFALQFALFSWVFALRWTLIDQQRRCPVCLRLLTNPVRIGQSSRMLLEWHGTELICLRGHGLLHIPDRPAIWFTQQRWTDFDPSWSGLFP